MRNIIISNIIQKYPTKCKISSLGRKIKFSFLGRYPDRKNARNQKNLFPGYCNNTFARINM